LKIASHTAVGTVEMAREMGLHQRDFNSRTLKYLNDLQMLVDPELHDLKAFSNILMSVKCLFSSRFWDIQCSDWPNSARFQVKFTEFQARPDWLEKFIVRRRRTETIEGVTDCTNFRIISFQVSKSGAS
jgi:hypothetical protein